MTEIFKSFTIGSLTLPIYLESYLFFLTNLVGGAAKVFDTDTCNQTLSKDRVEKTPSMSQDIYRLMQRNHSNNNGKMKEFWKQIE